MARPSLRSDSSQGVGKSSGRKKKEKKKPTANQKTSTKTAKVTPKPARKVPKSPRVKYTAADVRRMKKELEDLIEETEAEKDKNNMLVEEQTKELFELKRTEETQKEDDFDAGLKYLTEEAKECKKRMEIDKKSKKCEATICLQKTLDQSRGLSAHFQSFSMTMNTRNGIPFALMLLEVKVHSLFSKSSGVCWTSAIKTEAESI